MATDVKISQLPTVTNAAIGANSLIPVVDSNDSITKSIELSQLGLRYAPFSSPAPNFQRLISGTTYTTPAGAKYLIVELLGAAGGGAGSGTTNTGLQGSDGSNTVFNSIIAHHGSGAPSWNTSSKGGAGGSGTSIGGSVIDVQPGGYGQGSGWAQTIGVAVQGGQGGSSRFGGAGAGGGNVQNGGIGDVPGINGATNSGSGGGGAGSYQGIGTQAYGGAGGGAGEYVKLLITSPSATYSYSVGSGGAGGTAGSNGGAGGNGADGVIQVWAFFQ